MTANPLDKPQTLTVLDLLDHYTVHGLLYDKWNSILGAHGHFGLSKNEFCRKRGITPAAFSNAKQRISAGQAHQSTFASIIPATPHRGAYVR